MSKQVMMGAGVGLLPAGEAALAAHLKLEEKLEDALFVRETMKTARIIAAELFAVEGEVVALDPDVLFDIYDRLERREHERWGRLAAMADDVRKARARGDAR